MKKIIVVTLMVFVFLTMATTWRREYPLYGFANNYTVLASSPTTITLPNSNFAQQTFIINRGQTEIYYKFDGTADATCPTLKAGEALQNIIIPWKSVSFLSKTQSGSVDLITAY